MHLKIESFFKACNSSKLIKQGKKRKEKNPKKKTKNKQTKNDLTLLLKLPRTSKCSAGYRLSCMLPRAAKAKEFDLYLLSSTISGG